MKTILASTLALSLSLSVLLPHATAYASTSSVIPIDVSDVSMEDVSGINYANSVGYYLEKDIPQGLEFIILGEGDFALLNSVLNSTVTFSTNESSFDAPSTPISKVSGSRTLEGVWWGGILDDVGIAGFVAACTIATTDDTQSKASVKPGLTADWKSSEWMDTGEKAWTMASVGIAGNKAKWDLRAK